MIFRVRALGQAASGHLDVADDHVRLEVTLPWLLQRFAEAAQTAIKARGRIAVKAGDVTTESRDGRQRFSGPAHRFIKYIHTRDSEC